MRALLAAAAAVAVALVIVLAQPLRSPWWTYADADATYVASGLNLLAGERTTYLDHPGLPLQEVLELSFGMGWVVSGDSRADYTARVLLDLDGARPVFRGWAVALYLAGALVFALLCARLFGGALWGLAGGLLWAGAPGLAAMSIQFRPDVVLTVLCLVVGWLTVRAAESKSSTAYAVAAVALGLTATVKIHAAGLLVPLVVALVWRRPRDELDFAVPRWALGTWATAAIVLNANNVPFRPKGEQLFIGAVVAGALAFGYFTRRRRPALAVITGGLALGVAIPVSLDLRDGLQALVVMANGLTGGGVNTGVEPFSGTIDDAWTRVPHVAFLIFALGAVAALVGVARRQPAPILLFSGAAALGAMALARFADTHYFAPAYALSVPAALWLCRAVPLAGPAVAATLAVAVGGQALADRGDPAHDRRAFRTAAEPELRAALERAGPNEVVLTPSYWPAADTRFFEVVEPYTDLAPRYPYRTLPATERAVAFARERGLKPCCAVGGAEIP